MNKKIYSLVWNKSLRQIVVASELATVKGGGGSQGEASGSRVGLRHVALALAAALALGTAPWVIAAPAQGQTNCNGAKAACTCCQSGMEGWADKAKLRGSRPQVYRARPPNASFNLTAGPPPDIVRGWMRRILSTACCR